MQEIVERAKTDEAFSRQLFHNLAGTLAANGYSLSPAEVASLRAAFSPQPAAPPSPAPPGHASAIDAIAETIRNQQSQIQARVDAQSARLIDLGNATVQVFKATLEYSTRTYRMVTLMNSVMFWMGVCLFAFAALYGAFTHNLAYTGVFCGLGAASFISHFFLRPIEKTQEALSSLIQAEIAFMNYFEQISLAENYAMLPPPNSGQPTHEAIAKASEMLQQRSRETIEILHYIRGHAAQPSEEKPSQEQPSEGEGAAGSTTPESRPAMAKAAH